jgi:hypothetical protein
MKTKNLFLLLPLLLLTQLSFGQNHILKGRGLFIPGKPILYFNVGIGYEYLFEENRSLQLVYNYSGNDGRDTDGNANFKNEIALDYRFYNTKIKPISQAIFAFAFLSYSNEKNKIGGEVDLVSGSFITKKITVEKAVGIGIGKKFKLGKNFHWEIFMSPKVLAREITIETSDNTSTFSMISLIQTIKFGVRGGVNLAYRF